MPRKWPRTSSKPWNSALLEQRFNTPAGWQWQTRLETRGAQYLRYGWTTPPNPRALVVIFPGLSEYVEKYFETANDLVARGFAVACLDWREQGLSWRPKNRDRRHHDDFIDDVLDAQAMADALPLPHLPRVLLAHSMGGNIGLRVLRKNPGRFACAVMTAPMLGLPVPERCLRALTAFFHAIWLDKAYLPGHGPWKQSAFDENLNILTTDPARRAMQAHWMENEKNLRMGGLTVGWLRAALASIRLVQGTGFAPFVRTPLLVLTAGQEKVVSNAATRALTARIAGAELHEIPGSLHEILMERDEYRNQFWTHFDAFVDKHLSPR